MPKESDLEVKVGVFVIIAIVCLIGFVFSVSDFSVFQKGESYRVMLQFANGLKKGAPVRVAGVDAGHVREIKGFYDAATHVADVTVNIWMREGNRIPVDSRFIINQLGLLGEKYLEILPGVSQVFLVPGATVRGEDPIPVEAIIKTLGNLGSNVEMTLNNINTKLLTQENEAAFAAALANVASITGTIEDGEGTVGKFLMDPAIFQNMDELSADLKANPWKLFYRPRGK